MDTLKAERVLRSICKAILSKRFVMHGSLGKSNTLLPKRPRGSFKKSHNLHHKAIYGTESLLVAVMYATLPSRIWRYKFKKHELWIKCRGEGNELNVSSGFIHLCPKSSFAGSPLISASKRAVKVVRTFPVSLEVFVYLWKKEKIKIFSRFPGRH